MNHHLKYCALVLGAIVSLSVQAHSGHAHGSHSDTQPSTIDEATAAAPDGVTITNCWIRALPNRLPSAGYFQINNGGAHDAVLVNAQSTAFGKVMLHASKTVNGMAVMVHADKVVVPAGGGFEFAPNGHHVMLEQPTAELNIGKTLPITFWFEGERAVTADCEVRSPASVK